MSFFCIFSAYTRVYTIGKPFPIQPLLTFLIPLILLKVTFWCKLSPHKYLVFMHLELFISLCFQDFVVLIRCLELIPKRNPGTNTISIFQFFFYFYLLNIFKMGFILGFFKNFFCT